MKIEQVKKLSVEDRLYYWITERESIRLKKEGGAAKPWTDDEILQQYKFCNVRRMDDRVSRWLLEHWYQPYFDHPNMIVACTLARHFNNIECLDEIGFPKRLNTVRLSYQLHRRQERGDKLFSGAYMITGKADRTKADYVVHDVLAPIYRDRKRRGLLHRDSLEELAIALQKYSGIASFMAGQITADMRWAAGNQWSWRDRHTWAPPGPGSQRGMNRVLGMPTGKKIPTSVFRGRLLKLRQNIISNVLRQITDRMECIDYQNCLCEFDKYERTLWEGRRPKQTYPGQGS